MSILVNLRVMTYRNKALSMGINGLSRKRGMEDRIVHRLVATGGCTFLVRMWGSRGSDMSDVVRICRCLFSRLGDMGCILAIVARRKWEGKI